MSNRQGTMVALDAEGLDNTVQRAGSVGELKALVSPDKQIGPHLVLLDMREPNSEGRKFLTEAQRQRTTPPPVVIVIADRDNETAALEDFGNMIAGRISSIEPGRDFVKLIDVALSTNWSLEPASDPPE